jgi:hypothetical protein
LKNVHIRRNKKINIRKRKEKINRKKEIPMGWPVRVKPACACAAVGNVGKLPFL